MNILILSWRGLGHPNSGGAEQVTFEHAKAWSRAGHGVWLFTSYFKGAKKKETVEGVNFIRSGRQFFDVQIKAFFWYFFGKHPKFDLVIDEFHGIPFFTPLYVRSRRLAFIHEIAREVWKLNPWPKPFNFIPSFFGSRFEPWIFKIFYKKTPFMTVSNSTKIDLIDLGIPKDSITIVNNGVKLDLTRNFPNKDAKKTAMYLGALSEDKGTIDAIRAFGQIERKDDGWQFWVVGRGTKGIIPTLKDVAKNYGIDKKVKFWGFVSDKKKFELLARAHILINPSIHEGWGLVNIEANSLGTPVVGYNVHGLRESIKDGKTGVLVDRGNYARLAEESLKLVNDKEKYARFQRNVIKWGKKFTWEKATRESIELIESI
jgi:glycosyltransferase involved in cell wall biosynthesis